MKAIANAAKANGPFLISDSAIGRDCMPLFLPDWGEWRLEARLSLRVGRLGKCIASKFAPRYVDAIGITAFLRPSDGSLPSWLGIMDSVLTTGSWVPYAAEDGLTLSSSIGEQEAQMQISAAELSECIKESIPAVTKLATIKTGDIIVTDFCPLATMPVINTRLECAINGTTALSLKIK